VNLHTVTMQHLRAALEDVDPQGSAMSWNQHLVQRGLDQIPLPGQGATWQRWQCLAAVAERDLSLAKLYEGQTDALAILHELNSPFAAAAGRSWGVWAAESLEGRLIIERCTDGQVRLQGTKRWCSGAAGLSHGLLTAWFADGQGPQLVCVNLSQPGVQVDDTAWRAVGMAESTSVSVIFDEVVADCVGGVGEYISRPGFWHGGAGIAACWYGGARCLARTLQRSLEGLPVSSRTAFRLAALGKVDLSLQSTALVLRDAASWIDQNPQRAAHEVAFRARLAAERSAGEVLGEVGRALGAGVFCHDERFARMAADLPVFVRQSHAERDFAALGEHVLVSGRPLWEL
jgi:hypothetical protein